MDSTTSLIVGMLFSAVGFGYILYARKQKAAVPLVAGLGLVVIPYLFSSLLLLSLMGLACVALPYFWRSE